MKPKVYIETSVVSYLTAWRSSNLIVAAQQEATRDWWDRRVERFEVFVSEIVSEEASKGDPEAAKRRLDVLKTIDELQLTQEARSLAKALILDVPLPPKADIDALHIAIAATNGMDFLLTWNCKHIANPTLRYLIEETCRVHGLAAPVICTPLELTEGVDHEG